MARNDAPVLARPPSETSGDTAMEEEDALLTGERTGKAASTRSTFKSRWREYALFAWACMATAAVIVLAVVYQHSQADPATTRPSPDGKKNLIFMVSDGMGPTSLSLTRSWRQYVEGLHWDNTLVIDQHLIGQSRTRSSSSLVTDSAAGATAFSCGQKSYNGAISVLPNFEPCGSVMEAAKRMGYTTGLVVTTRITDATPAVFASHVRKRIQEDEIALQMVGETHPLGRMVDLMIGGGRCHFLSNTTDGSCRGDDTDVVDLAQKAGWDYISTRKEFDNLGSSVKLPLLGLFASGDVPYEIDRRSQNDVYPSLEETAKFALKALSDASKDSERGFFIMIEGSRIDHAGHANDPAAQVHEVLAYDRTMAAVLDFIKKAETPTLMVSTSDHETGGLATARQLHSTYPEYLWYPGVLANTSHSASFAHHRFNAFLDATPAPSSADIKHYLKDALAEDLGIHDVSSEEIDALTGSPEIAAYTFADMTSRRAQIGWSTHGHSAADVNIYTSDPELAADLRGTHENTEVGDFLSRFLGVEEEVDVVTKELKEHMGKVSVEQWLGPVPDSAERLDGQDHLDHYHGDH
ncbi:hypothetical protein AMS68_003974 [Peltaster fructicola]|uniref:Alkaline phosphatase n=1 Tax=Peltaster fructicola TaxID=286661 RepID=A0A6H0XUM0_9PEZI|nr:hypothetical protein AMS68_003974 [Peltaster fructicola]